MASVIAESPPNITALFPDFHEVHPPHQRQTAGLEAEANLSKTPSNLKFNPENVRNGLAQLVLTLVELLRELLERQALRRIDGGSLSDDEIERLGDTFVRLAEEIENLKEYFGFTDEDLNIDLGPLGRVR